MSNHLPESSSLVSILAEQGTTRKDSESEWLTKDNPETNPITIKPKTASHVAEQFSWVPWPYCSPHGYPFPIKSLALSADVFPQTIHFWVLDKSPVSGPGRGPLSCNSGGTNLTSANTAKTKKMKQDNSWMYVLYILCLMSLGRTGLIPS